MRFNRPDASKFRDGLSQFGSDMKIIRLLTMVGIAMLAFWPIASSASAGESPCPEGYRLQHQSYCVNVADALTGLLSDRADGSAPYASDAKTDDSSPRERIGYKFSNMADGAYCRTAYLEMSKPSTLGPLAMALGAESCGLAGVGHKTAAAAEIAAMKKCETATAQCRIILSRNKN